MKRILVATAPARIFHQLDRSDHRLASADQLAALLRQLPLEGTRVEPALGRLVVRFQGRLGGHN